LAFDHILGDVTWLLKRNYWEFSYRLKSKSEYARDFQEVVFSENFPEQKITFRKKLTELNWMNTLIFCENMAKIHERKKKGKNIQKGIKAMENMFLYQLNEEIQHLKYIKTYVDRIKVMLSARIFSDGMYDQVYKELRKRLLMIYVDEKIKSEK